MCIHRSKMCCWKIFKIYLFGKSFQLVCFSLELWLPRSIEVEIRFRRSFSLDSLLMAKVCLLLQSHQFCSSGFQEALLGQRRPTTLVRQRLVAPPSNSQLSPTSHLFSLSTTVLLGNLLSAQHQQRENFKNPLWWVSVHIRSSNSEPINVDQQTNTCIS